jgi:hypothetical protein
MLASIARLYQDWKRHEAARRELSDLSDRELAKPFGYRPDCQRRVV